MTSHYRIGQALPPADAPPAPFGARCQPAWYCITPKRTAAAHAEGREFFRRWNMHSFYPSEERTRQATGGRKRVTTEAPMVPGYLFAQCLQEPLWHVIKAEPWCAGVFKIGETVIRFPWPVIKHLQGMTVDAERLARAKAELRQQMLDASRPVEGKQARFVAGPFSGMIVTVSRVQGQIAHFEVFGKPIKADVDTLRKVE